MVPVVNNVSSQSSACYSRDVYQELLTLLSVFTVGHITTEPERNVNFCHNVYYQRCFYVKFKRTEYIVVPAYFFGLFYSFDYGLHLNSLTAFLQAVPTQQHKVSCGERVNNRNSQSQEKSLQNRKNSFFFPLKGKAIGNVICADIQYEENLHLNCLIDFSKTVSFMQT